MSKTQPKVFPNLAEGDRVRWTSWSPGRGHQERQGVIVEADIEHPIYNWALTMYKVETETGRSRVSSGDIEEVL